jgi:c-di-GMP-binding flagellar brake protein YcgR
MGGDRSFLIRKYPRVAVDLPAALSTRTFDCDATVLNLSLGGCRLESEIELAQHECLMLRLYVSYGQPPVLITTAVVRWRHADGHDCGVEFLVVQTEQSERLRQFLNTC